MFQQYPQRDFHVPIRLHRGRFRVRWGDHVAQGEGSACFIWAPSPDIEIEVETTARGIDPDSVTLELPGFETDTVVVHSHTLGPKQRLRAFVSKMDSGLQTGSRLRWVPSRQFRQFLYAGAIRNARRSDIDHLG